MANIISTVGSGGDYADVAAAVSFINGLTGTTGLQNDYTFYLNPGQVFSTSDNTNYILSTNAEVKAFDGHFIRFTTNPSNLSSPATIRAWWNFNHGPSHIAETVKPYVTFDHLILRTTRSTPFIFGNFEISYTNLGLSIKNCAIYCRHTVSSIWSLITLPNGPPSLTGTVVVNNCSVFVSADILSDGGTMNFVTATNGQYETRVHNTMLYTYRNVANLNVYFNSGAHNNNCIYNAAGGTMTAVDDLGGSHPNLLTSNPLNVDSVVQSESDTIDTMIARNARLQATSGLIDTADAGTVEADDILGNSRA